MKIYLLQQNVVLAKEKNGGIHEKGYFEIGGVDALSLKGCARRTERVRERGVQRGVLRFGHLR